MKGFYFFVFILVQGFSAISQCDVSINPEVNQITCFGNCNAQIKLVVSGGTTPYNYKWNVGSGNSSDIVSGLCVGDYAITISDAGFCDTVLSIIIVQPSEILVISTVTNSSCKGNDSKVEINATGGSLPYSYQWQNGSTLKNISDLSTGIYIVTVTDNQGCSVIAADTVISVPELNLSYNKIDNICELTGTINFVADSGIKPYTYFFEGELISVNSVTNLTTGNYIIEVIDANNCEDSVHVSILAVECSDPVPDEAFTPNGDGINDTWRIQYIEQYANCSITVYDRWGQAVLDKRSGYHYPWRGNNNSKELPAGMYYYVIFKDGNNKDLGVVTGSVAIVR